MAGLYERKAKSQKKHPCSTSSQAAFRPTAQPPSQKPGWKGPSYIHKKPKSHRPQASTTTSNESTIQDQILSQNIQQTLLDIFKTTFPCSLDFEALKPVLQQIKNALFERDFERAFGEERFLEAYAVRWSPSRALGYGNLLAWIVEEFCSEDSWWRVMREESLKRDVARIDSDVLCLGGGPAEIMAFAGMLKHQKSDVIEERLSQHHKTDVATDDIVDGLENLVVDNENKEKPQAQNEQHLLGIHLVDSAPWSNLIDSLESSLVTPPQLSKYASAAAKASNCPFLPEQAMVTKFTQTDILDLSREHLRALVHGRPKLITLFFTLNELYTTSIPKTTKFLLDLSREAPKGSVLLVVDSPGSYSEMAIKKSPNSDTKPIERKTPNDSVLNTDSGNDNSTRNTEAHERKESSAMARADSQTITTDVGTNIDADADEAPPTKKYPMLWLLEHALFNVASRPGEETWERVIREESRWFRLNDGLKYPVCLENMRFQVHMFRKVTD